MSKSQHEVHPHELGGYVREFTFVDGILWRSCTAVVNGTQCKYATGEGRSPATICKRHTFSDVDDPLPQLTDGVVAPEIEDDEPEPEVSEISIEEWGATARAEEVEEPDDAPDQDEEKQHSDQDEESSDNE
jgi:hypothetical protein